MFRSYATMISLVGLAFAVGCLPGPSTPPDGGGGGGGAGGGGGVGGAPECTVNLDCDDGNDCTTNECIEDACVTQNVAEGMTCNDDAGLCDGQGTCVDCINDTDCDAGQVCRANICVVESCEGQPDGTRCVCAACGGGGLCISEVCEDPVLGAGSGTTSWRAVPKVCDDGTQPNVDNPECADCPLGDTCQPECYIFDCTDFPDPMIAVPGGGTSPATVSGCEVPSTTLQGQIAVDTVLTLTATSTGDENLTVGYVIKAYNSALVIAASAANLVDVTITTDITSATPSQIITKLLPGFQNTPVGNYVAEGEFLLDDELAVVAEAVTPTSYPTAAVNFAPNAFLLELVLISTGAPLNITGAACTFDNPVGTCTGGGNALRECDPAAPDGSTGLADCTVIDPPLVLEPGTCERTDGADISFDVVAQ